MKRVRIGLHRLLWLLLVPLLLSVIGLWLILAGLPQPQTLTFDRGGVTGTLASDDLFVAYDGQCTTVRWQFDGAQAVERDGAAVAAAGSAPLCADSRFRVTLPDGTAETMLMPWRALTPHHHVFAAVSVVVLVVGVGRAAQAGGRRQDVKREPGQVKRQEHQERQEKPGRTDGEGAGGRGWALLLLLVIVLAAWALRLTFAVRTQLYVDEAWTYVAFAQPPLSEGVRQYWAVNNHPLNSLLIHVTARVWGESELAVRLPALWLGLLALAAIYQAGRTLYSRRVGVLAAALSAMWPFLSEYGWQARGYTGLLLCTFVLLTLAARQARRPTRARWVGYAVVGAVGMYFVSTMIYPLVLVSAWLVAQWWIADGVHIFRQRRLWALAAALVGAGLLTLALYTPQLHYLLTTPERPPDAAILFWQPLDQYLFMQLNGIARQEWTLAGVGLPVPVLMLLCGCIGAAWLIGRRPRGLASDPLLTMLALGLLVLLAHRPSFFLRGWMFFLPLLAITAAAGWVWLSDRLTRSLAHFRLRWALVGATTLALLLGWSTSIRTSGTAGLPTAAGIYNTVFEVAPALARALVAQPLEASAMTGDGGLCWSVSYYLLRAADLRLSCSVYTDRMLLLEPRLPPLRPPDLAETLDSLALTERGYQADAQPRLVVEDAFVWRIWRAGTAP